MGQEKTQISLLADTALMPKGKNMIAVVSGQRGSGKTWFSVTLAHALSLLKKKVLVFDADNGLNNTKIQLGLDFSNDLDAVIYGKKSLNQIIIPYEKGRFDMITGNPSSPGLKTVSIGRLQILGDDLDIVSQGYDKTVLDISSGLSNATKAFVSVAHTALVVCTEDAKEMVKNYEIIKHISGHNPQTKIYVVINQANSLEEGQRSYQILQKACQTFLPIVPELLAIVRHDTRVRDSIRNQVSLITRYPKSEAAQDVFRAAERLLANG